MKRAKLVLAAALAMSLTVGAAVPALAFYQQPQSKKGLLLSQQTADMLADIGNLGVKQVIVNMGTDQDLNTFDPLAAYCTQNGVTLTMIVINRPGAPAGMMPTAPTAGVGTYGFNVQSAEGQAAVRSYARSLAAMRSMMPSSGITTVRWTCRRTRRAMRRRSASSMRRLRRQIRRQRC